MLDECKGERFEELLSSFATLVLRKVLAKSSRYAALPPLPVGTASSTESSCIPLLLAHRQSLQKNLDERRQIQKQSKAREAELNDLSLSLSQRKATVLNKHPKVDAEQRGHASDLLRSEWVGDSRWTNAILYEGPSKHEQMDLQVPKSTNDVSHVETGTGTNHLLNDLCVRLQMQRDRLQRWKDFQLSLPGRHAEEVAEDHPAMQTRKPFFRFEAHQDIVPGASTSEDASKNVYVPQRSLPHRFAELLREMEQNLSTAAESKYENKRVCSSPDEAPGIDIGERAGNMTSNDWPARKSDALGEKVLGLSSPENHHLHPTYPTMRSEDDISAGERDPSCFSWLNETEQKLHNDNSVEMDDIEATPPESLTERTRRSMAAIFSSELDFSIISSDPPPLPKKESASIIEVSANTSIRRDTLMERTRKSMAATTFTPGGKATNVKPKGSWMSQLYPTNQFETPKKQDHRLSVLSASSNDSTPREKLFSEEAEYNSIFKSRPKIAQSPTLSPDRSAVDDSLLAREMTILDIGSDPLDHSSG